LIFFCDVFISSSVSRYLTPATCLPEDIFFFDSPLFQLCHQKLINNTVPVSFALTHSTSLICKKTDPMSNMDFHLLFLCGFSYDEVFSVSENVYIERVCSKYYSSFFSRSSVMLEGCDTLDCFFHMLSMQTVNFESHIYCSGKCRFIDYHDVLNFLSSRNDEISHYIDSHFVTYVPRQDRKDDNVPFVYLCESPLSFSNFFKKKKTFLHSAPADHVLTKNVCTKQSSAFDASVQDALSSLSHLEDLNYLSVKSSSTSGFDGSIDDTVDRVLPRLPPEYTESPEISAQITLKERKKK